MKMQDKIFEILFEKDDISWQSIIYELVRTEQMDPWDVDISQISQKYIEMLGRLKEMDFRISGKVVLAAAILLKMKSVRLVGEDIQALDRMFIPPDEIVDDTLSIFDEPSDTRYNSAVFPLIPRTPQPRKRKVSVFDLVNALEKALEVYERRPPKMKSYPEVKIPEKTLDISRVIKDVYAKIVRHFKSKGKEAPKLTFNLLLPENTKEDKVFTFIPLLHLDNQRKIDLIQEYHHGEIFIDLLNSPETS